MHKTSLHVRCILAYINVVNSTMQSHTFFPPISFSISVRTVSSKCLCEQRHVTSALLVCFRGTFSNLWRSSQNRNTEWVCRKWGWSQTGHVDSSSPLNRAKSAGWQNSNSMSEGNREVTEACRWELHAPVNQLLTTSTQVLFQAVMIYNIMKQLYFRSVKKVPKSNDRNQPMLQTSKSSLITHQVHIANKVCCPRTGRES